MHFPEKKEEKHDMLMSDETSRVQSIILYYYVPIYPEANPKTKPIHCLGGHPADGLNWTTSPTNSSSGSGIIITLDTELFPWKPNALPLRSTSGWDGYAGLRMLRCYNLLKEIPGMSCWVDKRQNLPLRSCEFRHEKSDLVEQNNILHQHQFGLFRAV